MSWQDIVKKSKGEWEFDSDNDVFYADYFSDAPTKERVLARKKMFFPKYEWKVEDINIGNRKGFRLFYRKK